MRGREGGRLDVPVRAALPGGRLFLSLVEPGPTPRVRPTLPTPELRLLVPPSPHLPRCVPNPPKVLDKRLTIGGRLLVGVTRGFFLSIFSFITAPSFDTTTPTYYTYNAVTITILTTPPMIVHFFLSTIDVNELRILPADTARGPPISQISDSNLCQI